MRTLNNQYDTSVCFKFTRADLNLLSQQGGFEVGLDDHFNLQFGATHLPDQRNDSEWQDDVLSGAISKKTELMSKTAELHKANFKLVLQTSCLNCSFCGVFCLQSKRLSFQLQILILKNSYWPHELIFAIRWDEADASLRIKLTKTHTLVERAVIDGYGLLPADMTEKQTLRGQTYD